MADTGITQNKIPAEHDLKSLLDLFKRDIFVSMNCHAIGTIQVFNPLDQTAQVTINYKKLVNGQAESYPLLLDCPVVILSGGLSRLELPISTGDECIVLFNDRDIDNWFFSGSVTVPNTQRVHSFSDGIVISGPHSSLNKITNYDMGHASLRNGPLARVGVSTTGVLITNGPQTLKTVIDGLIDIMKAFVTIPTVPGSPATLDPAVILALENYKTIVGGLLE